MTESENFTDPLTDCHRPHFENHWYKVLHKVLCKVLYTWKERYCVSKRTGTGVVRQQVDLDESRALFQKAGLVKTLEFVNSGFSIPDREVT